MKEKLQKIIFSESTALYSIIVGLIILISSILLFLIKGSWIYSYPNEIDEEKIAQYGDFVGGVIGSLFSLVGVILFYVALKDQRSDFKTGQDTLNIQTEAFTQQVKEFEAQREELKETRKIFEQQHKTMKNQQFDSNFYSLLNVFIQQRSALIPPAGQNYFAEKIEELQNNVEPEEDFINRFEKLGSDYYKVYLADRAKLSLYFITLYRLFKVIEDCDHLTIEERTSYHKILRALISKDELLILYYNYHSGFGKKPLPIVLKYNYFKHLEILSKIEFRKNYSMTSQFMSKANGFVDGIRNLIRINIEAAKSLETVEDVPTAIKLDDGILFGVIVNENLEIEIKLIIEKRLNKILTYLPDEFANLISYILIDILFYSNFEKFELTQMNRSKEIDDDKATYKYKFITQK